jgi:patatin-like phospholipase/acyl hydrolase
VYRILSLSGGGYLGLYTARFLELLENGGEPLGSRFDLIAGTSVGGLIALALAAGRSAVDIRKEIESGGSKIFPISPGMLSQMFSAGHSTEPLATVIDRLLGKQQLGKLTTRVAIPTVCISTGRVRVFRTRHLPTSVGDREFLLRDVALATSAAPTYYKPHVIGGIEYADGGIAANAPDAIAASDAVAMRWPRVEIRMLAVGTTWRSSALAAGKRRSWGGGTWLRAKRLPNLLMAAQMDLSRQTAQLLLPQKGLIVADPQQSDEQARELGLDRVSKASTATLRAIAEGEFDRVFGEHKPELEAIRHHQPETPHWFD